MGYIPKGGGGPGSYYGISLTPPNDGDFEWLNQGSAVKVLTNQGVQVYDPQEATENWRARILAPPSTPWYLVTFFHGTINTAPFSRMGLVYYDTGTGRMKNVCFRSTGWQTQQMNSPSSHNSESSISNYDTMAHVERGVWVQIADDGTNRLGYFSNDGRTWFKGYSEGRTVWATMNRVGFGVSPNNASLGASINMLHWKFHTSFQGTLISV